MRLSARSLFGTILALSALEVIASSSAAAGRVGGAFSGLGNVLRYLISPSVPLIPDLRARAHPVVATSFQQAGLTIPSLPPVQG